MLSHGTYNRKSVRTLAAERRIRRSSKRKEPPGFLLKEQQWTRLRTALLTVFRSKTLGEGKARTGSRKGSCHDAPAHHRRHPDARRGRGLDQGQAAPGGGAWRAVHRSWAEDEAIPRQGCAGVARRQAHTES